MQARNLPLRAHAAEAQARAAALAARTAEVPAEAERVLDLARSKQLRTSRVQQLTEEVAGLRRAMETRATIEQAKGVLMASVGCSPDDAFALLVEQSQHENRKLHQVAQELVARQLRA